MRIDSWQVIPESCGVYECDVGVVPCLYSKRLKFKVLVCVNVSTCLLCGVDV